MKNLAIITARSGSKGIKDKNIKLLGGKPLLVHSIEAAEESGIFDEIMVSTDSKRYAEVVEENGGHVPFLRNMKNATDTASSWDVVREVIHEYEKRGHFFDTVTLLQPTSPLRVAQDIKLAYECFKENKANIVVSVCEVDHSPLWTNTLPEDGSMMGFLDNKVIELPRQALQKYYRINGALYMADINFIKSKKEIYGSGSYSVVMPRKRSIDIDEEFDFIVAEAILNQPI